MCWHVNPWLLLNCCHWFSYLCVYRNTIGHCCCEWFCYFCVDIYLYFCVERYTLGHWSCRWFGYFFGWQLYTLGQFCCHWLIIFVLIVYLLFLCWSDMVKIVVSDLVIFCLVIYLFFYGSLFVNFCVDRDMVMLVLTDIPFVFYSVNDLVIFFTDSFL